MDDRANIEAVIRKFYEIISGTKSEPRNWSGFRELFVPDAQIWLLGSDRDIKETVLPLSLDAYIERLSAGLARDDFYEQTTIQEVHASHNIAAAISTYSARRSLGDVSPFKQGTCFLQLVRVTAGWRICSMIYQDE